MQELKIDTGVEEFRVNGRGVLRFNPADPNLYHRFFAAGKTLQQYDAELTAATEKSADAQAGLALLREYDGKIKALLQEIFGAENFYLELQDHGLQDQAYVNPQLIRLSRETVIPLVVTNDCHYINKEDTKMHHILICIQTNRTIEDEDTLEFGSD